MAAGCVYGSRQDQPEPTARILSGQSRPLARAAGSFVAQLNVVPIRVSCSRQNRRGAEACRSGDRNGADRRLGSTPRWIIRSSRCSSSRVERFKHAIEVAESQINERRRGRRHKPPFGEPAKPASDFSASPALPKGKGVPEMTHRQRMVRESLTALLNSRTASCSFPSAT